MSEPQTSPEDHRKFHSCQYFHMPHADCQDWPFDLQKLLAVNSLFVPGLHKPPPQAGGRQQDTELPVEYTGYITQVLTSRPSSDSLLRGRLLFEFDEDLLWGL